VEGDSTGGRYFGSFVPLVSGNITISVYLGQSSQGLLLGGKNFVATIYPADVYALNTVVTGTTTIYALIIVEKMVLMVSVFVLYLLTGTLYDTVAGVDTYVHLQLKDKYQNDIAVGGAMIELALLGVAGETNIPRICFND